MDQRKWGGRVGRQSGSDRPHAGANGNRRDGTRARTKKAGQGVEDPDQPGETVAASPVVSWTRSLDHVHAATMAHVNMTVKIIFMSAKANGAPMERRAVC